MSGLSVDREMLINIVAQLAGQGLTSQQGNNITANSPNFGHARLSSTTIVNEDEVLVDKQQEEFTLEELLSKRKRSEKATQAQQTFSVGKNFETRRIVRVKLFHNLGAKIMCIKDLVIDQTFTSSCVI